MPFFDRFRKPPTGAPLPKPQDDTEDRTEDSAAAPRSAMPQEPVVNTAPALDEAPVADASAPAAEPRRFLPIAEERFNLEDTSRIAALYELPREQRDAAWLLAFQEAAWNASIVLPAEPVFLGPDGMPYVRMELPPPEQQVQTNCLSNIYISLAAQGLGAAFFRNSTDTPEQAEYVMPTGVLESLRSFGTWDGDPADTAEMLARPPQPADASAGGAEEVPVSKERQVMVGSPSPEYLPKHTAQLLYRHLTEGWKMEDPRVALVVDAEMTPTRNLVIGRKFSDFPDREVAARATQMLLWYLPPRRYLLLMPEDWNVEQLRPLKELC